jgi:hypothetical protein
MPLYALLTVCAKHIVELEHMVELVTSLSPPRSDDCFTAVIAVVIYYNNVAATW